MYATGNCISPRCIEPTTNYLDSELNRLNNNVNISYLVIIDNIINNDCYEDHLIRMSKETEIHRKNQHCPDRHANSGPFTLRTSCPWFPVADTDLNRYPRTIYKAETNCDVCIGSIDLSCEPLIRQVKVLSRNGTCGINGEWQYEAVDYNIPIAFTCTKLRETYG